MKVAFITTDSREHFQQYDRPEPYFGTAPQALLEGMMGLPGLEVHVISCARQPMKSPAKLAPNMFYHALLVRRWGWMRTGFQGCVRAVRRKLSELKPDLVHGQGTERDCALDAVFSGFPSVLTVHGNMRRLARLAGVRPFSYGWLTAHLEGWVLPRALGVVCISQHTRREVESLARRTWVVPNAVDAAYFNVVRRPPAIPTVLCVANISPIKNQHRLIRALDGLGQHPPFKAVFHGLVTPAIPYHAEFMRLVNERPWCEYRGFADKAGIRQALSEASLLVLASLEDNCPMVVLEAMAAGVPVVASRVGGVPDLIEDGETGLLIEPEDVSSMTAAVQRMLADEAGCARMTAKARERAKQRFEPRAVAERHLEIYAEVLGRRM
jgi:glycosyltransferase involved in cell wall biosynthesis